MPKIKFRAWDDDNFRMIYSDSGSDCFDWRIGMYGIEVYEIDGLHTNEIEKASYMQCTGLQDKNGVYIYDGDIVMLNDNSWVYTVRGKWIIEYSHSTYMWWLKRHHYPFEGKTFTDMNQFYNDCEVIGNIHENPELMEVTQ